MWKQLMNTANEPTTIPDTADEPTTIPDTADAQATIAKEKHLPTGMPGHGIKKIKAERKRQRQARKANRKRK